MQPPGLFIYYASLLSARTSKAERAGYLGQSSMHDVREPEGGRSQGEPTRSISGGTSWANILPPLDTVAPPLRQPQMTGRGRRGMFPDGPFPPQIPDAPPSTQTSEYANTLPLQQGPVCQIDRQTS